MSTLTPGSLLGGRYSVKSILGEGAQSFVYLTGDLMRPGAEWAVKVLRLNEIINSDRDNALTMFRREAEIMRTLQHPSLPRLIDFRDDDGSDPFIVMERIKGTPLDILLKTLNKPMDINSAFLIAMQLADALALMHGQDPPVIYRDLKPANLILSSSGLIRIIDLGIARFKDSTGSKDTQELGTPGFCAPEQYRGSSVPQSDLYSLGVLLFYMLTMQDPQERHFVFPELKTMMDIPQELSDLTASCTDIDPAKRPPSAQYVRDMLSSFLSRPRKNSGTSADDGRTNLFHKGLRNLALSQKFII